MKPVIIFSIFLFTIFSCRSKPEKPEKSVIKIDEYKMEIKTENKTESEFETKIKTNFPENTPFTITVSRDCYRKNNPELYAMQFYYSYASLVKNGEINFTFNVDDKKWIDEDQVLRKEQELMGRSITEVDRSTIVDSLVISVLYTPKADQSNEIKEIIGKNGENLKGNGVEQNNGFKIFNKEVKIYSKSKI